MESLTNIYPRPYRKLSNALEKLYDIFDDIAGV